jgi:hypothetical protein
LRVFYGISPRENGQIVMFYGISPRGASLALVPRRRRAIVVLKISLHLPSRLTGFRGGVFPDRLSIRRVRRDPVVWRLPNPPVIAGAYKSKV